MSLRIVVFMQAQDVTAALDTPHQFPRFRPFPEAAIFVISIRWFIIRQRRTPDAVIADAEFQSIAIEHVKRAVPPVRRSPADARLIYDLVIVSLQSIGIVSHLTINILFGLALPVQPTSERIPVGLVIVLEPGTQDDFCGRARLAN